MDNQTNQENKDYILTTANQTMIKSSEENYLLMEIRELLHRPPSLPAIEAEITSTQTKNRTSLKRASSLSSVGKETTPLEPEYTEKTNAAQTINIDDVVNSLTKKISSIKNYIIEINKKIYAIKHSIDKTDRAEIEILNDLKTNTELYYDELKELNKDLQIILSEQNLLKEISKERLDYIKSAEGALEHSEYKLSTLQEIYLKSSEEIIELSDALEELYKTQFTEEGEIEEGVEETTIEKNEKAHGHSPKHQKKSECLSSACTSQIHLAKSTTKTDTAQETPADLAPIREYINSLLYTPEKTQEKLDIIQLTKDVMQLTKDVMQQLEEFSNILEPYKAKNQRDITEPQRDTIKKQSTPKQRSNSFAGDKVNRRFSFKSLLGKKNNNKEQIPRSSSMREQLSKIKYCDEEQMSRTYSIGEGIDTSPNISRRPSKKYSSIRVPFFKLSFRKRKLDAEKQISRSSSIYELDNKEDQERYMDRKLNPEIEDKLEDFTERTTPEKRGNILYYEDFEDILITEDAPTTHNEQRECCNNPQPNKQRDPQINYARDAIIPNDPNQSEPQRNDKLEAAQNYYAMKTNGSPECDNIEI